MIPYLIYKTRILSRYPELVTNRNEYDVVIVV